MADKTIHLELSNNQALHLWGMMSTVIHDTTNELKRSKVFSSKGELNRLRKHLTPLQQEKVDNIDLARLIVERLEKEADFAELTN